MGLIKTLSLYGRGYEDLPHMRLVAVGEGATPSQGLLDDKSSSQAFLSRKGREGGITCKL